MMELKKMIDITCLIKIIRTTATIEGATWTLIVSVIINVAGKGLQEDLIVSYILNAEMKACTKFDEKQKQNENQKLS